MTGPEPAAGDDSRQDSATRGAESLTTAALAGVEPAPERREAELPNFAEPAAPSHPIVSSTPDEPAAALFPADEAGGLRAKWDAVQTGFVDEPHKAVELADALVAGATQRLAEMFAQERSRLESQWDRDADVSTEDLRVALRRYRSFFGRLLSV